jgi:hypothetical protein
MWYWEMLMLVPRVLFVAWAVLFPKVPELLVFMSCLARSAEDERQRARVDGDAGASELRPASVRRLDKQLSLITV